MSIGRKNIVPPVRGNRTGRVCVILRADEGPIILGIDSSTDVRSVAVARGEAVLSTVAGDGVNNHSARMLCEVDEALRQAGLPITEVGLFAVASGPGSFTGLRAGMALALAFASALRRPVYAVRTLRALAESVAASAAGAQIFALLPAGRGEVFGQLFTVSRDGVVEESGEASHLPPSVVLDGALRLRGRVLWCGRGAETHAPTIREYARGHSIECVEADENISESEGRRWVLTKTRGHLAATVAAMALGEFRAGRGPSIDAVRPTYVRGADAELKK